MEKDQLIAAAEKFFSGRASFATVEDIGGVATEALFRVHPEMWFDGTGMDGDGMRMWLCLLVAESAANT